MTKATKRTIGVLCLLWLGTLLLLFANYKTKVYLEQLRNQVDAVTQQEQTNATAVKKTADPYHGGCLSENRCTTCDDFLLK